MTRSEKTTTVAIVINVAFLALLGKWYAFCLDAVFIEDIGYLWGLLMVLALYFGAALFHAAHHHKRMLYKTQQSVNVGVGTICVVAVAMLVLWIITL